MKYIYYVVTAGVGTVDTAVIPEVAP